MAQGPSDTILVAIWITLRIREFKVRNPDPPDRRRFVLSEHIFLFIVDFRVTWCCNDASLLRRSWNVTVVYRIYCLAPPISTVKPRLHLFHFVDLICCEFVVNLLQILLHKNLFKTNRTSGVWASAAHFAHNHSYT